MNKPLSLVSDPTVLSASRDYLSLSTGPTHVSDKMTSDEMVDYANLLITCAHMRYIKEAINVTGYQHVEIPHMVCTDILLSMRLYNALILQNILDLRKRSKIVIEQSVCSEVERLFYSFCEYLDRETQSLLYKNKRRIPNISKMVQAMKSRGVIENNARVEHIAFAQRPFLVVMPMMCDVNAMDSAHYWISMCASGATSVKRSIDNDTDFKQFLFQELGDDNKHWILGVFELDAQKFALLDSLQISSCAVWGIKMMLNWYKIARNSEPGAIALPRDFAISVETFKLRPHQMDAVHCGFYCAMYIEMVIRGMSARCIDLSVARHGADAIAICKRFLRSL